MILLPGQTPIEPQPDPRVLLVRSGWHIPCVIAEAHTSKRIHIRANAIMKERAGLILRSVDDYPYNCVGMIFAARRAWIEIDELYQIFQEDDYTRVDRSETMQGDVVVYRRNRIAQHVGLIVTIFNVGRARQITVMSKWGLDAEFIHEERNVPEIFGQPVEYWTDRKYHE